jgi:tetratricopeptide (TPR) repeat protein
MTGKWRDLAAYLVLAALVLAIYLPVGGYGFLLYDDKGYVTENRHVLAGLTAESVAWAFSDLGSTGNWHPLTWISHMLDVQLFGSRAGAHHLVNLLFHLVNAGLLFGLLRAMTGARWRSLLVAALFAAHPLHVETVAWIAERKDVLSTALGLLSLAAYLRYARRPGAGRYAAVLLLFALSLMAKPMLVTLPVLCLLLDLWPLNRLRRGVRPLLLEKAPLLSLSLASSVVAYVAQGRSASLSTLGGAPLPLRLVNAATGYLRYIGKTLWPADLAVLYPYPIHLPPPWQIAVVFGALAGVSLLALYFRRRFPFLLFGWLWYLVSLLPVIGLIQVGGQAIADRYTYLPLTGLFVLAAWGGGRLAGGSAVRVRAAAGVAALVVVALAAGAAAQVRLWADDVTLFGHTLAVTSGNWPIENNMGVALLNLGRAEDAATHFRAALQSNPAYGRAYLNLGIALARSGAERESRTNYEQALRYGQESAEAHYNLGVLLAGQGAEQEAVGHYREAIRINPELADAYTNLAEILLNRRGYAEAEALLLTALRLNPRDEMAHLNLGAIRQLQGNREEAAAQYRAALALRPGLAQARQNLESLGIR